MNVRALGAGVIVAVLAATGPASAHHSYAMFDQSRTITVPGTIAKVEWQDPHVFFWAYVSDGKGGYDLYGFESASINNLARQGWTTKTLKVGDKVAIAYSPLRDGRHGGFFRGARFADGSTTPGATGLDAATASNPS